ncbi:MAG TPA: hypothetical protein PLF96_13865 [Thermotogota bacterium]|nr:hypothetical protein [Thermotogota bacterium]
MRRRSAFSLVETLSSISILVIIFGIISGFFLVVHVTSKRSQVFMELQYESRIVARILFYNLRTADFLDVLEEDDPTNFAEGFQYVYLDTSTKRLMLKDNGTARPVLHHVVSWDAEFVYEQGQYLLRYAFDVSKEEQTFSYEVFVRPENFRVSRLATGTAIQYTTP